MASCTGPWNSKSHEEPQAGSTIDAPGARENQTPVEAGADGDGNKGMLSSRGTVSKAQDETAILVCSLHYNREKGPPTGGMQLAASRAWSARVYENFNCRTVAPDAHIDFFENCIRTLPPQNPLL